MTKDTAQAIIRLSGLATMLFGICKTSADIISWLNMNLAIADMKKQFGPNLPGNIMGTITEAGFNQVLASGIIILIGLMVLKKSEPLAEIVATSN